MSEDRRRYPRKGSTIQSMIPCHIVDDESVSSSYLFLVDVSFGGMRLKCDHPLPENKVFTLIMELSEFVSYLGFDFGEQHLDVQLVWQRELNDGSWMCGLTYDSLGEEAELVVEAMLEKSMSKIQRTNYRLGMVLGVELRPLREGAEAIYPIALDLSSDGMRIVNRGPLARGEMADFTLFLGPERPELTGKAVIRWAEKNDSGFVHAGLQFVDLTPDETKRLYQFVQQCSEFI